MSLEDLPADAVTALTESFTEMDTNKDGCISYDELSSILNDMGLAESTKKVKRIIYRNQGKSKKLIDFDTFSKSMAPSLRRLYLGKNSDSESSDEESDACSIADDNHNGLQGITTGSELRSTFAQFDVDGNGYIDPDELQEKLAQLSGLDIGEEEVAQLIKEVDVDGDGRVNYEEFVDLILTINDESSIIDINAEAKRKRVKKEKVMQHHTKMLQLFKEWDSDGNGLIDPDELREKLGEMTGTKISPEEADVIIKGVDKNGDGMIDYEEFCKLMSC